jgi:hypothetical protein
MKKIFLIIGIVSVLTSASQASEWKIISSDLTGYNFYTNKIIKDRNF